MQTFTATDFIQGEHADFATAERLGHAVVEALARGESPVSVSFVKLTGVSSSFFNLLFRTIKEASHATTSDDLEFVYNSPTQRIVVSRSLAAVFGDQSDVA